MGWIILIVVALVFIIATSMSGGGADKKGNASRNVQKRDENKREDDVIAQIVQEETEEHRHEFIRIGIDTLISDELDKTEKADLIIELIDSLDENFPEQLSEKTQCEIVCKSYDKLIQRFSLLKNDEAVDFLSTKLEETKNKVEVTTDDYAEIIDFIENNKPEKKRINVIYSLGDDAERKQLYEKFLDEYKDYSIEELEALIQKNKKDNYSDYTLEDKQKWRAMKTIIEKKQDIVNE